MDSLNPEPQTPAGHQAAGCSFGLLQSGNDANASKARIEAHCAFVTVQATLLLSELDTGHHGSIKEDSPRIEHAWLDLNPRV